MSAPDPHGAVQAAIIAALKDSTEIAAFFQAAPYNTKVENRVFDSPPASPPYPYITVGDGQSLADKADGDYDGDDNAINVHCWAQEQGNFTACKQMARMVRAAVDEQALDVGIGLRLVQIFRTETRYLRDPDGITTHAVVMFEAFTEPT